MSRAFRSVPDRFRQMTECRGIRIDDASDSKRSGGESRLTRGTLPSLCIRRHRFLKCEVGGDTEILNSFTDRHKTGRVLTGEDRHPEGDVPDRVDRIRNGLANCQVEVVAYREADVRIDDRIRPVVHLEGAAKSGEIRLYDHDDRLHLLVRHALTDQFDDLPRPAAEHEDRVRARPRSGES
jgi:hypothetical protein